MRLRDHARLPAGIVRRREPGFDRDRRGDAALEIRQEGPGQTIARIGPAGGQAERQQDDGKAAQGERVAPGDPRRGGPMRRCLSAARARSR